MIPSFDELSDQCSKSPSLHDLYQLKAHFLGKKGLITEGLKALKQLDPEQRRIQATHLNQIKSQLEECIALNEDRLQKEKQQDILNKACPDPTLPGLHSFLKRGGQHPIMQIQRELIGLFVKRGFDWSQGPDIETDFYNFEALNIPDDHPARQMHDTFYINDHTLLRTHTSPVQIRYMKDHQPPVKMIAPGRVYRCDYDPTHTPMFHQIEGLVLQSDAGLAQLRALLEDVLSEFFQQSLQIRFRPSFFPFTDPSLEVDMSCVACHGKGCSLCKHSSWIEVLGCGIVHPQVISQMGYDPEKVQGYAFGLGVERLAMLKYQVPDLRLFFENHFDFLSQFTGSCAL